MDFSTNVKLTIRGNGRGFFGPGIAELMERIRETGSTKDACVQMGLSYTKGRRILKRAEAVLGYPLITIRHAGSGGRATTLTEEGELFLLRYRELEADVMEYAMKRFEEKL